MQTSKSSVRISKISLPILIIKSAFHQLEIIEKGILAIGIGLYCPPNVVVFVNRY